MVGGASYARSTYNRAVRSRRQPGSAFKPFVYAAALAKGYSPVSVLTNLGHVTAPGDPEWSPRSEGEQPDALTLRAALLESNNPAAADLQQRIGSRAVLRLAGDAGLSDLPDVPSLALGSGVVSPLDLTAAYTMFPGDGQVARPRGMISVFDSGGRQVFDRPVERAQLIAPAVAFQMTSMLRDVDRARHRRVGARARCPRPGRGEDRHDRRLSRRLVRGLLDVGGRRRLGRLRSAGARSAATPTAPASRCRSGPIS